MNFNPSSPEGRQLPFVASGIVLLIAITELEDRYALGLMAHIAVPMAFTFGFLCFYGLVLLERMRNREAAQEERAAEEAWAERVGHLLGNTQNVHNTINGSPKGPVVMVGEVGEVYVSSPLSSDSSGN